MENDTNKKPAKKGWGHIVILFLLAAYFFRIFVVYLYVGSKTGMIEILLQKGAIRTVLSPIIAILFMAAAIYELICYRRGCGKKTIRIVEAAVLIVSVSFFLAWGAAHGSTVSHFPEDFTESPASITTPLLSTISPDEDSQVQVELKRAENGFSHAISHILYSKSDLAECAVVQQSLNGDFDSKTGIAPSLFYYTTTRYTNLAQSSISNAYSKEWLRLHVENNSITTKGKIGECKYMYVSGETQYLIMWTERAILTVEYSGSGILTDFLSEYACALS